MFGSFTEALRSQGPAADRAGRMSLYAFLIGDWEMDGVIHRPEGKQEIPGGEIHAEWVLEGPERHSETAVETSRGPGVFYGSTLRVYDPSRDEMAHSME